MPKNKKQTSPKVASQAGKDLKNKQTPQRDRGPIGSALSQSPSKKKSSGKK